ncbi:MAG: nitrilase-related carbon-nitrogen hydrolase [Umezawaea sp.]
MSTDQVLQRHHEAVEPPSATDPRRWVWLGVGAAVSLLAVHGRFDIPLAAWIFPVLLLRFTRTTPAVMGLALVWLVSAARGVFWMVESAVPMTVITVVGAVALGTVTVVPFVLDRITAGRASLLLFPAALAAGELLMSVVSPFGTAFGVLAPTQHDNLVLLQVIGVTGPHGIAFLIGWFATLVNLVWAKPKAWRRAVGAYAVVLALVLLGGGAALAFAAPSGASVRVAGVSLDTSVTRDLRAVVGADVPSQAIDPDEVRAAFGTANDSLFARTREAARAGAKIVVWSEQAANVLVADEPAFLAEAAATAREERIYLQVAEFRYLEGAPYAGNRTRLFDPTGAEVWVYDKSHPIPGLESYPAGPGVVPVVSTPYGRLATVTCFDADFPELARVDADIMIVPARDWAEISAVHGQKANLRSVENGYSMIRQAEFGTSGAFDPQGRVLSSHDYASADVHVVFSDVPVRGSSTVYRSVGDLFAWLCLAGTIVLTGFGFRRSAVPVV